MGFYHFFIILICFICIVLNGYTAKAAVWYNGPESVHETNQFTITCNSSLFANIKWRKSGPITDLESKDFFLTDGGRFSNITIKYALPSHSGNYKCSYEFDDYGHNLTVIVDIKLTTVYNAPSCQNKSNVNLNRSASPVITNLSDNVLKCMVVKPYEKFSLQCKPESNLPSNLTVAWYKASKDKNDFGKLIKENERLSIKGNSNDILEFVTVIPEDTGIYHCRVIIKGEETNQKSSFQATQLIEIQVLPWVKSAHKDVTAIEENSINLTCIVFSNVSTTVIWIVNSLIESNKTYTESEGRIILSSINNTMNNVLSIKSANISIDRGTYTCIAKSDMGYSPSNMTFYVRIKSKYAALWPFLGICAEVIILCTIILIYEKKRDKTELEESDTDQGPETKNSPDHGQDSVRYRNYAHFTVSRYILGKAKQLRKIAQKFSKKKLISLRDSRITPVSSALFFQYNTQLGPPYHILIDTNFVNFSIKYKLDIIQNMMDCLYAKCIPYVTDCVIGELEKLGQKYKIALKIVRDPRFERIQCMHSGTYADDCLVERITQHKCFIVATCDKDLKRRIRKIPGVPIMYISHRRYTIERMPDAYGAPKT
ncbi:hypothetical protein PGB90_004673 [Kerria lacca]